MTVSNWAQLKERGFPYGTLTYRSLGGRRALDGAVATFMCDVTMERASPGWMVLTQITGSLRTPQGDAGRVFLLNSPSMQIEATSPTRTRDGNVAICVPLTPGAIRRIDEGFREAPDRALSCELWLEVHGASEKGIFEDQAILKPEITDADWRKILRESGWESRFVIDVPVEYGRAGGVMADATEHFRRAVQQRSKASYSAVLVECRNAIEALQQRLSLRPADVAEWDAKTQKLTWNLSARIEYARSAIRHILHLGAHMGTNDDPAAEHADLVLGLVGSLVRYYAERQP
jgi:hypothetical protein